MIITKLSNKTGLGLKPWPVEIVTPSFLPSVHCTANDEHSFSAKLPWCDFRPTDNLVYDWSGKKAACHAHSYAALSRNNDIDIPFLFLFLWTSLPPDFLSYTLRISINEL